jgi:hypothetical protein
MRRAIPLVYSERLVTVGIVIRVKAPTGGVTF